MVMRNVFPMLISQANTIVPNFEFLNVHALFWVCRGLVDSKCGKNYCAQFGIFVVNVLDYFDTYCIYVFLIAQAYLFSLFASETHKIKTIGTPFCMLDVDGFF